MSSAPNGTAPSGTAPSSGASGRHRPTTEFVDERGAERAASDRPERATPPWRAFAALGVAAIGAVAFSIGLRSALRRLPPERPAAVATDSAGAPPRTRRFAPPAPNEPDEFPRLR